MKKILIVEDEIYARKSMKKQIQECMKEQECRIFEAVNGKQGIEIVKTERPDMVFTDIRMPVMDGLEFLKQLRNLELKIKVVMVSAYADFEYAKSAIKFGAQEYLLKPIDDKELRECLGKLEDIEQKKTDQKVSTGEDSLARFISERIFSDTYAGDFVNQNIFRKIFGAFQIVVLYFKQGQDIEPEVLFELLRKTEEEKIFTGFRLIQIQKFQYVIVMYTDGQSSFRQKKLIKNLRNMGISVWAGVSRSCTNIAEIRQAYQQAMVALEYKVFYQERLFLFEDIARQPQVDFCMTDIQKERLKIALVKGNLEKSRGILGEIFKEISGCENISRKSLELFLTQISLMFHQISGLLYRFRILEFDSMKALQVVIEEKMEEICSISEKRKMGGGEEIVQNMKIYAKEHCSKDITVKMLAEEMFFMNADYLSHLFKEKVGESYSVYLKNIRLKKAKELLKEDKFSVTEVAAMTGYNDTSQFIRVFKQNVGITPKKYRDEQCKGED